MMLMQVSVVSPDYKKYIVHHFSHLDLMDAVVPLTMPLILHDTDAGANCVTYSKKSMLHLISVILT